MIQDLLRSTRAYSRLIDRLPGPGEVRTLGGLAGSSPIVLAAALAEDAATRHMVLVAPDPATADEVEADLDALSTGRYRVFPQRESVHPELNEPHIEISARRVEALQAFLSGRARILVTTGRALSERFHVPESWQELEIEVKTGLELDMEDLTADLERSGYQQVSMVEGVGEYAIRGGIVDIFPVTTLDPVRIEFWADRVESIRAFDVFDQRSIERLDGVRLLPIRFPAADLGTATTWGDGRPVRSLPELLPESTLLIRLNPEAEREERRRGWEELSRRSETPEHYQHPPETIPSLVSDFATLEISKEPGSVADPERDAVAAGPIDFGIRPPESIDRRIDRLIAAVQDASGQGGQILILCDNDGQVQRLEEILEDALDSETRSALTLGLRPLAGGFVVPDSDPPLWLFTDHEIFRRARRQRARPRAGRAALESLSALAAGDYVVHLDHGIGRFQGLERVSVSGEELETLVIEYAGGELLRVPHYRADLIERWIADPGTDGDSGPALHRLGGKTWQRLKKRTRNAIETMAAELLELYAARRLAEGHAFSPDTRWQREMEAAFLYQDTPDQEDVTQAVKADMESTRPMDRLICGDAGYGKTEIAIRAAFKAVQDSKQVAVLAPTTVLVEQHLDTFRARLAEYPVRIASLSRFRTPKEQDEIVRGIARGTVDIVIGTHRLLSSDVTFRDLGLLIVDEEQRFGVAQKEKLKALRRSVDVLTMTATPIPRTLHLSLSGLRDLSLIRTPPRNRRPIITHLTSWEDRTIEDAIRLEVDRGGQVFFVHNRVESIEGVAARVRRLVPDLRVEVGHGQMPERQLESTMTDFVRGDIDVLVATAIVENGLDVPNANTMIIHRADWFGLAQLYQIRGRVGRSHQRAYCYLVVPPNLPLETERRLRLLEQHTELGSGYRIALRDLELRGAGNLLGAEQSGFAQAVGFDTYLRLLDETVRGMQRGTEDRAPRFGRPEVSVSGATYLPDRFIPQAEHKLDLYRRLSKVADLEEIRELEEEVRDRFGPLPEEAHRLIGTARLRILGSRLGVERILVRPETARVNFRRGSMPRLAPLREELTDRHVQVEVKRLQPLSLLIRQPGSEDLLDTVVTALERLDENQPEAVATG